VSSALPAARHLNVTGSPDLKATSGGGCSVISGGTETKSAPVAAQDNVNVDNTRNTTTPMMHLPRRSAIVLYPDDGDDVIQEDRRRSLETLNGVTTKSEVL